MSTTGGRSANTEANHTMLELVWFPGPRHFQFHESLDSLWNRHWHRPVWEPGYAGTTLRNYSYMSFYYTLLLLGSFLPRITAYGIAQTYEVRGGMLGPACSMAAGLAITKGTPTR